MNSKKPLLSFDEAIELGKYEESYLKLYPEWQKLDMHLRYQFINKAIINRRRQLRLQWAAMANQPDYSKKPELKVAQKKVEQALRDLDADEEAVMIKYAGH